MFALLCYVEIEISTKSITSHRGYTNNTMYDSHSTIF